ncbi:MAG: hypothetical protein EP343_12305 [Deltaproteobacteria bacterium]|nr:MAG: hypothetical protein EP343_12305 [Deltaproteobacteria bacterium]
MNIKAPLIALQAPCFVLLAMILLGCQPDAELSSHVSIPPQCPSEGGWIVSDTSSQNEVANRNVSPPSSSTLAVPDDFGENESSVMYVGQPGKIMGVDAKGQILWTFPLKSINPSSLSDRPEVLSLVTNPLGNVYAAINFRGQLTIADTTYEALGNKIFDDYRTNGEDIALLKLNSSGQLLWSLHIGSKGGSQVHDIALDKKGHIILAGQANCTKLSGYCLQLGGQDIKSGVGQGNHFLLKLTAQRDVVWAQFIEAGPTYLFHRPLRITSDSSNHIYMVFATLGPVHSRSTETRTIRVGLKNITSNETISFLLAKLNSQGELLWSVVSRRSYSLFPQVATNSSGDVFVAGSYYESITFGSFSLHRKFKPSTPLNYALFTAKFNAQGKIQWLRGLPADSEGNTTGSNPTTLWVGQQDDLYIVGNSNGELHVRPNLTCTQGAVSRGGGTNSNGGGFVVRMTQKGEPTHCWSGDGVAHGGSLDKQGHLYISGYYGFSGPYSSQVSKPYTFQFCNQKLTHSNNNHYTYIWQVY